MGEREFGKRVEKVFVKWFVVWRWIVDDEMTMVKWPRSSLAWFFSFCKYSCLSIRAKRSVS